MRALEGADINSLASPSVVIVRTIPLALVTALLVGVPVYWAFPDGLSVWRSVAIVMGWAGCGLLLANVFLVIRESWLAKQLGGLEQMYVWHHWLGLVAYIILLCHPLALALDSWNEYPSLAWAVMDPWQQSWPGWLGWVALLCLMIGMNSALMRRTSYSTWRWRHWLLAIAIAFSVAHLFVLGLDFALLWSPFLAIGFIVWRVVRADWGMAAKPFVVSEVHSPANDIVEVLLRPLSHAIQARPGQFVLVAFHDGPHFRGCREFHPFTISAIGQDGALSLGIKALGDCTRHLQTLESGVSARIHGPFGDFLPEYISTPSLWIAGGIGITPFLARLRAGPPVHPVHLIYLYRTEQDAAFIQELQEFDLSYPSFSLTCKESGSAASLFSELIPETTELLSLNYFLCGPPGLVAAAVDFLTAQGVSGGNIHFERFDFR